MKRVLFLAYLFPPIANSGTQRPLKFVKYLSRHGWQPTVVTAAEFAHHQIDDRLCDDIPSGVPIVRVPMFNDVAARWVGRLTFGSSLGARMAEGVRWRLAHQFRTPDLYALWKPTATRAAINLVREGSFDAIYATGFPWTSLVVGRDVSKRTGLPLVADFRDPWSTDDLFRSGRSTRAEEFALESAVVRQATAVVTVSQSMTRQMIAAHRGVDPSKFVTIHNGFDPEDFATLATVAPVERARFRIVYTGVWKTSYNPAPLYDAIDWIRRADPAALDDVEVIAAGFEPGEASRRGLSEHINEPGVVAHDEAIALMASAGLLFLTNGDGARQTLGLPGKMYEYLASGRPVLAMTDPEGDAGRIIRRVGGGIAISPRDRDVLFELLTEACRRKRLDVPPQDRHELAAFDRSTLARQLASLLDEVTRSRAVPADARRMEKPAHASRATDTEGAPLQLTR